MVILGIVTAVMKMPVIKTVMTVMILISIPLLNKKSVIIALHKSKT